MDTQEQINELKLEVKRLNNVMNIDHSRLNQLTQKFNAHRDKKDIHDKRMMI